jgi:hypothetical protein
MAGIADYRGQFVSVHTETWNGAKGPGRRDTLNLLQSSGEVLHIRVPTECQSQLANLGAAAGTMIVASCETRAYENRMSYTLAHVEKAAPAATSAPAAASNSGR